MNTFLHSRAGELYLLAAGSPRVYRGSQALSIVSEDSLALFLAGPADNGGLCDAHVAHEGALDLGGGDAVPRDVHHVVYPARDPVVAVLLAARPVTDEVDLRPVPRPVGLPVALGVLVEGAQHGG